MSTINNSDNNNGSSEPRRRLLKSVATGGSALGLAALPGKWARPMVASVVLPAHAQTSSAAAPLGCGECLPENLFTQTLNQNANLYFSTDNLPEGVSYSYYTGYLSGSFTENSSSPGYGRCLPPCDENLDSTVYTTKYFTFDGSGTMTIVENQRTLCGEHEVARLDSEFTGTYGYNGNNGRLYYGSGIQYQRECNFSGR